ncbi:contractile injection system tape measure protein [Acaryochloris sp. IP29b_bin.148]|uniref:contractile injection system tape measure protein n=1 Tax=Acaryochloris sp. IP29b_bin.148 TaxID=2969218 RepID=UPI00260FC945|nr:contractile injection system tape measure protein [Acaryochloris sp. IP29b_bin.148]
MSQQRHTIKQQILDLRVGSNIKAFELQNQLSALYRSKIISLIQVYCDQISDPDTLVRINTLDIDLGEINLQTLETDFVAKVKDHLYQQLAKKLGPLATAPSPTSPPEQAITPTEKSKSHPPTNPTESLLEIFSYFLQTGRLPWWCDTLSPSALEDCCEQLLRLSPVPLKALLQAQLKYAKPLQRLIDQFSDQTLSNLVTLLAPARFEWVQPYTQDIQALKPHVDSLQDISPRQFRLKYWLGIFGPLSLSPTPHSSADTAIRNHLLHLSTSFQINLPTLWQQLLRAIEHLHTDGIRFESELPDVLAKHPPTTAANSNRSEINNLVSLLSAFNDLNDEPSISSSLQTKIDTLLRQLNSLLQEPLSDSLNSLSNQLLTDIATLVTELETQAPTTYRPLTEQIKVVLQASQPAINLAPSNPPAPPASPNSFDAFDDPVDPFSESEEIYIQNAGLILLWPFLPRLFEALNLLQANHFIDPQTTERAVLLLQYLVDESIEFPEHLLPLNKLMCGLDLLDPIAAHLDITELERTECNILLRAVIHNWSALKNTTPKGFRRTFLHRAGILRLYNGNWLLQIERETYDILLDQLPWSIRVVKLPWMPEILHVEW